MAYNAAMEARIVINPAINNGRPTIQGTRITAQTVLEFLRGDTIEDILACLRYASRLTAHQFTARTVL